MKKDQVLDYMDSLEKEDKNLDLYVKMYEALSSFLTDFDFMKDSLGMTQKDVADKMGTTQSASSRIESLKTNPSYKQLLKMAEAVGGDLYITPMKDMTVQVPYDLQETVRKLAEGEDKTTNEYLDEVIRDAVESEYESYTKMSIPWNKVCEPIATYNCESNFMWKKAEWSMMNLQKIEVTSLKPETQKIAAA
jgi:transcriptional regulator with XRE-family HTH domain